MLVKKHHLFLNITCSFRAIPHSVATLTGNVSNAQRRHHCVRRSEDKDGEWLERYVHASCCGGDQVAPHTAQTYVDATHCPLTEKEVSDHVSDSNPAITGSYVLR